ncbi:MAG: DNA polymerase IV [Candidatus Goldbacteria bacterium]|nr:DNA polymerase IV [Candidatus Goldiibacteriota bacterium]
MDNKIEKKILLIDMNSYFASVEQMCNPALKGKPVIVCGRGRTVVVTASYEAREYGIKTGMTIPEARKLCPNVNIVYGNLDKYIDTSLKIHKIFLDFTDRVEVFSIDECFIDVTDVENYYGGAENIALIIKRRLKYEFGLTCSIGIGPNKVIAKLAAKMKKPDGLTIIPQKKVQDFLKELSIEKMQGIGIGKHLAEKFKKLGINTAADLGNADPMMLSGYFGILGQVYKNIGLGIDYTPVRSYYDKPPVKSVGHSYTFPQDTNNIEVIKSYLLMLSEKTGERLRYYKMAGKTVCIFIRFSDFSHIMRRNTYPHYFNSGVEIFKKSIEILVKNIFPLSKKVRLLGVSISGLTRITTQEYLFEEQRKNKKLIETVDEINGKYGQFTIKPLSMKIAENFGILKKCGVFTTRTWKK